MDLSYFDTYTKVYIYVFTAVLGLCMGSFLNCCAYRACHKLSVLKGRSMCDHCGHVLGPLDLVPVFSYLFSGGKCRYCGTKLSPGYVVSEVITALAYVLTVNRFGISWETLEYIILVSLILCASFADMEDFLIPDGCIIIGIVNRLIFVFTSGNIRSELLKSVIGAFAVSVPLLILAIVMEKILKKDAMGGGDIKLVFMMGSYLTVPQSLLGLLIACFAGLLFAFAGKKTKEAFPFGPSLGFGFYISLLYGAGLISWYLNLF